MRLLVITNIYPPQNLGGFGLCIERLTRGLEDIGYNTYVLTGNQSQLGEVEKEKKVERSLRLLGDYKEGVQHIEEEKERKLRQETNLYRIEEVIKWHKPNVSNIITYKDMHHSKMFMYAKYSYSNISQRASQRKVMFMLGGVNPLVEEYFEPIRLFFPIFNGMNFTFRSSVLILIF